MVEEHLHAGTALAVLLKQPLLELISCLRDIALICLVLMVRALELYPHIPQPTRSWLP